MYSDSEPLFPYNNNNNSTTKQDGEKNTEHMFNMESGSSQTNSGLLRFRSAPSSLLEDYAKKESLSSRFCHEEENGIMENASMNSQMPPQYPRQSGGQFGYLSMGNSTNMDHIQEQPKIGSGLMRQNSSPAGLFSHISSQSSYVATTGNEDNSPFSNRNFTSGMTPSLGMLSRINEIENENVGQSGVDEAKEGDDSGDHLFYDPGYEFSSWSGNSPSFSDNFGVGIKKELDNDQQLNGVTQNREAENRSHMLTHHVSLPKTSMEMANLLHLQDSVPCKIRAKRGCATHPRSIAERVRRTKISERMRKLQDLVPNMDKQTNTADMLDLAVEYIKNLQKEYKTLSEKRANCKCWGSQKSSHVSE